MTEYGDGTAEITGLFNDDALLQRRVDLHEDLGKISVRLCDAQQEYNDCITEILKTNEELRRRGVDTSQIASQLFRPLPDTETA